MTTGATPFRTPLPRGPERPLVAAAYGTAIALSLAPAVTAGTRGSGALPVARRTRSSHRSGRPLPRRLSDVVGRALRAAAPLPGRAPRSEHHDDRADRRRSSADHDGRRRVA